jgi:hypothetical protein
VCTSTSFWRFWSVHLLRSPVFHMQVWNQHLETMGKTSDWESCTLDLTWVNSSMEPYSIKELSQHLSLLYHAKQQTHFYNSSISCLALYSITTRDPKQHKPRVVLRVLTSLAMDIDWRELIENPLCLQIQKATAIYGLFLIGWRWSFSPSSEPLSFRCKIHKSRGPSEY